ncbi:hypothetical protein [Gemmata sp.]|uniref:hypothetical protein n=1 Tax=Gemmata sp. TaxID=1914242 RepID=UPI003F6F7460
MTAIAPDYTHALPAGSYAWVVVPGSVPSVSERLLADSCRNAVKVVAVAGIVVVGAMALVGAMLVLGL